MKIDIVKPKGHAFCRMCFEPHEYIESSKKENSLRGKKALRIEVESAQGTGVSFYCMKHARVIKNTINTVIEGR